MIKKLAIFALLISSISFAQQYTPNVGLQTPAPGSEAWIIPLNYNFARLDGLLGGSISIPAANIIALTTWQSTTTYATGNVVFYLGVAYSALSSNTNTLPTNTMFWSQVIGSGSSGSGTVTNFSFPGSLGQLFTCTVNNPTTTPMVTCSVANAGSGTFYGNVSGGSGMPTFVAFPTSASVMGTNGNGAPISASASNVNSLLQALTGCNTAGFVYSPQSGTCISQTGGSAFSSITAGVNTANLQMGSGGSLSPTGTGVVNANQLNGLAIPASATIVGTNGSSQPISLTVSALNSFIQTLTGCSTSGNVYTPAGVGCIANSIYPGAGVANSTGSAWGTSYSVGVSANNLLQLNSSSQIPAVSAALLTNFPASLARSGANADITSITALTGSNPLPALTTTQAENYFAALTGCNTAGYQFVPASGVCVAPSSGGNVSNSGTPTSGQAAVWTSATVIQGVSTPSFNITGTAGGLSSTLGVANGGTGKTSFIAYAPIVGGTTGTGILQSMSVGTAKQVQVSGGASAVPNYVDYPAVFYIPAVRCDNGVAGAINWSYPSGTTITCRAGSNTIVGYLQVASNSTTNYGQFIIAVPEDWDSGANPYIRLQLAYPGTDGASAHTIIPNIQVGCIKGDGTTTDDPTLNAKHDLSTITLSSATANLAFTTSNVQLNSTDMTGCVAGSLMTVQVGRDVTDTATGPVNYYSATMTFPRLIAVQAN